MKKVEYYLKEDRLKKVTKDSGKARSLLERSRKRMESLKEKGVNESYAFQSLENAYESIRESIESLMALKGFKSRDHVATIAWAAENLDLSEGDINKLHKFRKLRNASRYEAEEITPKQAQETIDFGEQFIKNIHELVENKID
ncbi:MAG: hypothetical protein KGY45_04655 [Hadesarchaea archaeon]|nr:hypothetical protein [Hadesarchaea archaeon]